MAIGFPHPPRLARLSLDGVAVLLWVLVSLIALFLYRDAIATNAFLDADDYLRLAQVRDLLAGQNWFDISQHRINPLGGGGMMHWSRFIDVQIAGMMLFLTPLFGAAEGERWAVALYPLLLILPLFLLLRRILGALGDRRMVIAGLFIAATGVTFLHYFAPLRIDHHNWQLLLSVAMLWLALGKPTYTSGAIAALVITIHSEISIEGLPYMAIFGGLFALDWLRDERFQPRLAGYAAGLVFIPSAWLMIFRGWQSSISVHCDGFSLPYVAAVAGAGLVLFVWTRRPASFCATVQRRLAGLALAGAAGAAAFVILGRQCLAGPFGALEPLVRVYWYDRVMEGQPIWAQRPEIATMLAVPTLLGIGAAIYLWRRENGGSLAENWMRTCLVLMGSGLLSMLVFRTTAVTQAYLTPAFAALALLLWDWGRARSSVLGRVGGVILVIAALPVVDSMIAYRAAILFKDPARLGMKGEICPSQRDITQLADLKPVLLFAPLDIGPKLLVGTPHSVIATGHHRNHVAMNRVITAFLSDPDVSEPIIRRSGATYLLLCTRLPEIATLAKANPRGLAATLIRGETVSWLQFEPNLSHNSFQIYRIRAEDQPSLNSKAVPFMQ